MRMPSASAKRSTGSPKRGSPCSTGTPAEERRFSQKASEPAGTEKAVAVVSPTPLLPRLAPGHGKKVRMVPGEPMSSPKVKVIGAGVVEVDGALDEAQTEQFGIEIEIALRVRGDGGDVMKSHDGLGHDADS